MITHKKTKIAFDDDRDVNDGDQIGKGLKIREQIINHMMLIN